MWHDALRVYTFLPSYGQDTANGEGKHWPWTDTVKFMRPGGVWQMQRSSKRLGVKMICWSRLCETPASYALLNSSETLGPDDICQK